MFSGTYDDRVPDSFVLGLICCIGKKALDHPILYIDC